MRQIIIGGEWGEYRKYANIPMRLEGGRQESNGKNQLLSPITQNYPPKNVYLNCSL